MGRLPLISEIPVISDINSFIDSLSYERRNEITELGVFTEKSCTLTGKKNSVTVFMDKRAEDISGIERLPNLQRVSIYGTPDLSPLTALPRLEELDLCLNENYDKENDFDLSGIEILPKLKKLRLSGLSVKGELKSSAMTTLALFGCTLESTDFLSKLSGLRSLWLCGFDKDFDLSVIGKAENMKTLVILGDEKSNPRFTVSDADKIGFLPNIEKLDIYDFIIDENVKSDLIAKMSALKTLRLGDKTLDDISFLAGLKSLKEVILRGCNISDISPLCVLPKLKKTDLLGLTVTDLSLLENIAGRVLYGGYE